MDIVIIPPLDTKILKGKTNCDDSLTFCADDIQRFRHKIFKEKLGWELQTVNGLEQDIFDSPHTAYILAVEDNKLVGCVRLLPCSKPYLLQKNFSELLYDHPAPASLDTWEISRLAFSNHSDNYGLQNGPLSLMLASGHFGLSNGIHYYVMVIGAALERRIFLGSDLKN